MDEPNQYEMGLGGLCHDTGKFFQRASASEEELSAETRGLENTICRLFDGRYTHRHVLFTSEFCSRHLFQVPDGIRPEVVHALAAYHHNPSTPAQEMIKQADWLSSGMDRIPEPVESAKTTRMYKKVGLRPVFQSLGNNESKINWQYALSPIGGDIFPFQITPDAPLKDLTRDYAKLWKGFLTSWEANQVKDPWGFVNRCVGVFEQYTWCIPSATWGIVPDISLYDHCKTTAAIAVCLHMAAGDSEPFLLVLGDFGGIQSYIFDIHAGAGGLAKRLRARSFFVDLAMCSVAFEILRSVQVPLTNCLLLTGGKFLLLLPNTEHVRSHMSRVRTEMDRWSLAETAGEVHLNVAEMPCAKKHLLHYQQTLGILHDQLATNKIRPLASHLLSHGEHWNADSFVLDPVPAPQHDEALCSVCQKRGATANADGDLVCDYCDWDARMGAALPKASLIAFYDSEPNLEGWPLPFNRISFLQSSREIRGKPFAVLALDGMQEHPENQPLVISYRARYVPCDEWGNVREFEEIGESSAGRKALACLKLDIDNVGWIFQFGLAGQGEDQLDRRSVSRLSTLSNSLTRFFSLHMEGLIRKHFPGVYTVYSGGDDLLCLGPWDQIFALAGRLRQDFRHYCCENPALTVSAGIALFGTKTPIILMSEETERLLQFSKETGGTRVVPTHGSAPGIPSKNRVTALETSLPWDLFDYACEKSEALISLMAAGEVSTGQVRRLLHYSDLYRQYQVTGNTNHFMYGPLMVYDLKRNWKKASQWEAYGEFMYWVQALSVPKNPDMALLRFITEYALYGMRGNSGGENG
ncbi:MAG: type III-A CRISPR-associated protein Cas10/Csm1 [Desulfomonile sp.]